jgi:hypothetical protein
VRLTVTHDELTPEMRRKITNGWPRVLSSLKSFLETGRPLDIFARTLRPICILVHGLGKKCQALAGGEEGID